LLNRYPATVPVRLAQREFVTKCVSLFTLTEPILDVGSGYRSNEPEICTKRLVNYYTLDINPAWEPDFLGAAEDMSAFPDGLFGTVLCTELLEHVPNPHRVVDEIRRVLISEGYLLVSVPFWVPIHRKPPYQEDYWRFTPDGLMVLLNSFSLVMIELFGPGDAPEGIFALLKAP